MDAKIKNATIKQQKALQSQRENFKRKEDNANRIRREQEEAFERQRSENERKNEEK